MIFKTNMVIVVCILFFPISSFTQQVIKSQIIVPISTLAIDKKESKIKNYFGLRHSRIPNFFQKEILISQTKTNDVFTQEPGTLIYFDVSNGDDIPQSFGTKDLAIIENNNQVRFHYSLLHLNKEISAFSFREINDSISLGSLFKDKTYSLQVNKNDVFLNPILSLQPTQLVEANYKLHLGSVLLESGIYNKFINSEKPIRIPLRKFFNIYVYAYEKISYFPYHKFLPRSIQVSITDVVNKKIIFDKITNYTSIQNNKLNNQLSVDEMYRKYSTIQMLRIGTWEEKDRLSSFIVSVKVRSFSNLEETLTFPISFY